MNTIKEIPANIELNETKRVKYKTIKNTPIQHKATNGCIATAIPNKVATPFPPLKFAQMGKICPSTEANSNPIIKLVLSHSSVR